MSGDATTSDQSTAIPEMMIGIWNIRCALINCRLHVMFPGSS